MLLDDKVQESELGIIQGADYMTLRIALEKTVGKECSSIDDGIRVLELITSELVKGSTVELDFKGVSSLLTPFLNACFGALLERFGKEMTMTHVVIRNVSNEFLLRINEYIDRKNEENIKGSNREMLQEFFDDDDLTDISL